jgi:hypothetical protein
MSQERVLSVAWEGEDGARELSSVAFAADSVSVDGRLAGAPGSDLAVDYCVSCDVEWRTRYVFLADAASGRTLELTATGRGHWADGGGHELPGLRGAIDVDISATPFTNTLPIRRLELALGESAEIVTAFVVVPELRIMTDPQRYTRIGPRTYRFESLDSDFTRDITVDDDGLVLEYPGLFSRR